MPQARGGHSAQQSVGPSGFTLSFYHVWVPLDDDVLVALGLGKSMELQAGCLGDFKAKSLIFQKFSSGISPVGVLKDCDVRPGVKLVLQKKQRSCVAGGVGEMPEKHGNQSSKKDEI